MPQPSELRVHTHKILIFIALIAAALIAWKLSAVLLLVFGAVVVATLLLTLSGLLRRVVPVPQGAALALVLVLLTTGLSLMFWLFGSQATRELTTLIEILPAAYDNFQDWLNTTSVGALVHEQLETLGDNMSRIATTAGAMAMTFTSGMMEVFLVVVGGIYLAAQPDLYRTGLLKLVPTSGREVADDALRASGNALRLWLGGQLIAMIAVSVLTGIGLWLLGVPAAFALALIAFLLDFVPIIGPILAAIPGILLGFTVSPKVGLATLVLYVVIQQIESNVLQPLIQQRAVELPPALLLFALIGFGVLQGIPGLLLAAPLTVVGYVLVKRLYVQEVLDTETPIPGDNPAD